MSDVSEANIAVTGATGRLGGRVSRRLAAAGIPQTLVVRDPSRAPQLTGATVAVASFDDFEAVLNALSGKRVVFMVSASESTTRIEEHRTFVTAAAAAGVEYLVYTSFVGASPDATFTLARDHWATEQDIRDSGLAFTFLRDNLYADFIPLMVGDDGVIRGPAGNGRAAVVAQDDIADAAVSVLTNAAQHAGVAYDLTGPESLTFAEMAEIVSRVTGRAVTYHDETVEEAYASRGSYGVPAWQLDAWVSTYTAVANGEMDGLSNAVPTLTGRSATSLADVVAAQNA